MMEFQLTEEQRLIQETARRIARERVAPRAAEIDETAQYPHDIFEAFREVGLLGLTPSTAARPVSSCFFRRCRPIPS
jgi:alkylation response protein AidB-like acyl-CoA dehydrogenase